MNPTTTIARGVLQTGCHHLSPGRVSTAVRTSRLPLVTGSAYQVDAVLSRLYTQKLGLGQAGGARTRWGPSYQPASKRRGAEACRPSQGPKPGLSLARIVHAAVDVASAEGLAAVSMSRIASELGAAPMSLYRYLAAKDELLALMIDAAFQTLPGAAVPNEGWREGLSRWAREHLAVLRRYPWIVRIPITGPPITPNQVAWFEHGLTCLRGTGLSEQHKISVLLLVNGFVRNDALLTSDLKIAAGATGAASREYRPTRGCCRGSSMLNSSPRSLTPSPPGPSRVPTTPMPNSTSDSGASSTVWRLSSAKAEGAPGFTYFRSTRLTYAALSATLRKRIMGEVAALLDEEVLQSRQRRVGPDGGEVNRAVAQLGVVATGAVHVLDVPHHEPAGDTFRTTDEA